MEFLPVVRREVEATDESAKRFSASMEFLPSQPERRPLSRDCAKRFSASMEFLLANLYFSHLFHRVLNASQHQWNFYGESGRTNFNNFIVLNASQHQWNFYIDYECGRARVY